MAVRQADVKVVFETLCLRGLGIHPRDVPESIAKREQRTIKKLLEDVGASDLCNAINYGMPNVWPFSEDGRPFDARDLERNLTKALGAAAKRERRGEIPVNLQTLVAETQ